MVANGSRWYDVISTSVNFDSVIRWFDSNLPSHAEVLYIKAFAIFLFKQSGLIPTSFAQNIYFCVVIFLSV